MLTSTRLFGDGKHGQTECIQTFRCQACYSTFSARRNTPLYRLRTSSHQVAVVLSALAEGFDPSAAERVFGFRQATITTWLSRAGEHTPCTSASSFISSSHTAALRQAGLELSAELGFHIPPAWQQLAGIKTQ